MTQEQKDDLFLIISQLKGNGQIDLRACAILRDAVEEIAAATPPPQGLAKEQKDNIGKLFDKYVSVGCVVTQGDKTEFLYALSGLLKSAAPQTDADKLREELEGAKKDNEAFKREFTEAMDDVARLGGENEKLQKEIERVKGLLPGGENCECVIPKPIDPYHPIDKHICRDCNGKINDNNL